MEELKSAFVSHVDNNLDSFDSEEFKNQIPNEFSTDLKNMINNFLGSEGDFQSEDQNVLLKACDKLIRTLMKESDNFPEYKLNEKLKSFLGFQINLAAQTSITSWVADHEIVG